jgi:hypothetical protein
VEAFVLSGGNLDVLLTFHGPLIESDILKDFFEDPIFHETIDAFKEIDSETLTYTTEFKPEKPGTYAICLDNRKSRFMSKIVQVRALYQQFISFRIAKVTQTYLNCTPQTLAGRPAHLRARVGSFQGGRRGPQDRGGRRGASEGVPQGTERHQPRADQDPTAAEAGPPSPGPAQRDEQQQLQQRIRRLDIRDLHLHRGGCLPGECFVCRVSPRGRLRLMHSANALYFPFLCPDLLRAALVRVQD